MRVLLGFEHDLFRLQRYWLQSMGLQDLVGDKRKTNTIAVKGSSNSKHVLWNLVTFSVTFLASVEEEEEKKKPP